MRKTNAIASRLPYTVLRDDREKRGHGWDFGPANDRDGTPLCRGTEICHLPTGDYTLRGFERVLCIERKATITEFVGSITNPAFGRELDRMAAFAEAFVILEFGLTQVMQWPESSRLSPSLRRKLPLQADGAVLGRLVELQLSHPTVHFLPVDFYGVETALCIFKRVIERHACEAETA